MRFLHVLLAVTMATHQASYSASTNYAVLRDNRHLLTISISDTLNVLTHTEGSLAFVLWPQRSEAVPVCSCLWSLLKRDPPQSVPLNLLLHAKWMVFASTLTRLCSRFPMLSRPPAGSCVTNCVQVTLFNLQGCGTLLSCRSVATSAWMWALMPSWVPGDQSRDK